MSAMDKIKQMLKGHEDQARKGVDKAGDTVDDRTHGKYGKQVKSGQDKLKQHLGSDQDQDRPPRS
ncbi:MULTISPECIES: antitoxin [Streptomyces]|uniref:Antitoxin n=1 Tax=Streptomyces halstedii TaxID=1944 RepID=A0A6N9TV33_STRHA|nr:MULTISPECIES: antitoxin [Streptomyces]AWL42507.1 antitoxin [Streptomyces sp. SM18]MBV7673088.1 antitoxin [Streptomyces halstedii]NEA15238.1 antitoxin [Streptomyces halstedii]